MTYPRPVMPWVTAGCTACHTPTTVTVDLYHGRRCVDCPPRFDTTTATELQLAGWPWTAAAYQRTWEDTT